jgi:hypothetical protein
MSNDSDFEKETAGELGEMRAQLRTHSADNGATWTYTSGPIVKRAHVGRAGRFACLFQG